MKKLTGEKESDPVFQKLVLGYAKYFCYTIQSKESRKSKEFLPSRSNIMATDLNTIKLSRKGQVTISANARRQLGLKPETNLLEVVINNCLILIPQDEVLSDILLKAKESMKKIGLSANQLKKDVEKRRVKNLSKRYPKLLDD